MKHLGDPVAMLAAVDIEPTEEQIDCSLNLGASMKDDAEWRRKWML